jgi:hypothetical protein
MQILVIFSALLSPPAKQELFGEKEEQMDMFCVMYGRMEKTHLEEQSIEKSIILKGKLKR